VFYNHSWVKSFIAVLKELLNIFTLCTSSFSGLSELHHNICDLHKREDDVQHFSASDVVIGPGSKELIFLLMCVTGGGSVFKVCLCMSESVWL